MDIFPLAGVVIGGEDDGGGGVGIVGIVLGLEVAVEQLATEYGHYKH